MQDHILLQQKQRPLNNPKSSSHASSGGHSQPSKRQEFKTDDTLGQLTIPSQSMYFKESLKSNQFDSEKALLEFTFSHCNLQWMEKVLEETMEKAAERYNQNQSQIKGVEGKGQKVDKSGVQEFAEQIESMQKSLDRSLTKIAQTRRVLIKNLPEKLLKSSAAFAKNHTIKTNKLKYLQLLMSVQKTATSLRKNTETEEQIQEYRDKLKASGIVLTTEMLESALLSSADKFITNHITFRVKSKTNLNSIVHDQLGRAGHIQAQAQLCGSPFYSMFKKYILLKRYLVYEGQAQQNTEKDQQVLDEICQQKLRWFMVNFSSEISRIQFEKAESAAQCFPSSRRFIEEQGEEMRYHTVQFLKESINNIQNSLSEFEQVSFEEDMSETLKIVESRSFLFEEGVWLGMVISLIISYLNAFFIPVIVYLGRAAPQKKNSDREVRYIKVRIIQLYFLRYTEIITKLLQTINLKPKELFENWGCKIFTTHQILAKVEAKNQSSSPLKLSKEQIKGFFTARSFAKTLNESYGRSVIYLANKIHSFLHLTKALKQIQQEVTLCSQIQALWVDLISQEICQNIVLDQSQENSLGQAKFMNDKIADRVAAMCEVNSETIIKLEKQAIQYKSIKEESEQREALEKQKEKKQAGWGLFKKKSQKQIQPDPLILKRSLHSFQQGDQRKEELYSKIMKLNLKTFRYGKLMEISVCICRQEEIWAIHQGLYQFYRKKVN